MVGVVLSNGLAVAFFTASLCCAVLLESFVFGVGGVHHPTNPIHKNKRLVQTSTTVKYRDRMMTQQRWRDIAIGAVGAVVLMMLFSASTNPIPSGQQSQISSKITATPYHDVQQLHRELELLKNQVALKTAPHAKAEAPINIPRRKVAYPPITPRNDKKRILVTGGAGFVGSHLVDVLMMAGHEVTVLDNMFTGRRRNIEHWLGHPNFELVRHDIVDPYMMEVDQIYHLACPASPPHYQHNPIKTIKTSVMGTLNMLGLAKRVNARLLFTSTSEVYGDPEVHPQTEEYWGHVNPIGPRACYDEGKRVAETMCYSYAKQEHVEVRVARIFNTYGPRMNLNDGRVVSNFIKQALNNEDITIYGDGKQTRSFQYVSDLVNGLIRLMNGNFSQPVNIGNPTETTILQFAEHIRDIISPDTPIKHLPASQDDPKQRKPDITRAKQVLGWEPVVNLDDGLNSTISYFKQELKLAPAQTSPIWLTLDN